MSKKTILKLVNETLIEIEWEVNIMGASILGCTSSVNTVNTDNNVNTLQTPLEIAGVVAWFDAAYGAFVEITGASATTLSTNDARVGTWRGRRNTGDQADVQFTNPYGGANAPLYKTGTANGRPVVRFSGAQWQFLAGSTLVSGTASRTIFAVVKPTVVGSGLCFFDLYGNGTGGGIAYGVSADCKIDIGFYEQVYDAAASTSAFNVVTARSAASTNVSAAEMWLNSTKLGVSSSNDGAINTTSNESWIGRMNGGAWWGGDIAELIVFNVALADEDRQAVEEYLAGKYAI